MGRLLINCDLGENESDEQTKKLLGLVDAASICCGVHAGSPDKTRKTLRMAARMDLLVGAHPGLAVAGGRGRERPGVKEFSDLLKLQLMRFLAIAEQEGATVAYVKLHGSLYHLVEQDRDYARIYLQVLISLAPGLGVFALAGGAFSSQAVEAGLCVWSEGFADRAYLNDGSLVPRSSPGAVLSVKAALARYYKWQRSGLMDTLEGGAISLQADTFCVHGDSPDAESLLRQLRELR